MYAIGINPELDICWTTDNEEIRKNVRNFFLTQYFVVRTPLGGNLQVNLTPTQTAELERLLDADFTEDREDMYWGVLHTDFKLFSVLLTEDQKSEIDLLLNELEL